MLGSTPPFGFDIAEMNSSSNEDRLVSQKSYCAQILIESARFPLRVRYSGDIFRSLEVPQRGSREFHLSHYRYGYIGIGININININRGIDCSPGTISLFETTIYLHSN